jgi:hypothetical protein
MKAVVKVVGGVIFVAGGFIAGATLAANGTRIGIGAAGVGNTVARTVSYPFRRPDAGRPNEGRPQTPNN